MGTREKILVGLMIAALLYGAFELFIASPENRGQKQAPDKGIESARQMSRQINAQLGEAKLSRHQDYILKMADQPWRDNPFYVAPLGEAISADDTAQTDFAKNLQYTGYLEIGRTRMAILNGVEYRAGQRLENGGGIVSSISPNQVVIESEITGEKRSVPYTE